MTHIKTLICRAVSNLVSAMFTCAVVLDILAVILDERTVTKHVGSCLRTGKE